MLKVIVLSTIFATAVGKYEKKGQAPSETIPQHQAYDEFITKIETDHQGHEIDEENQVSAYLTILFRISRNLFYFRKRPKRSKPDAEVAYVDETVRPSISAT